MSPRMSPLTGHCCVSLSKALAPVPEEQQQRGRARERSCCCSGRLHFPGHVLQGQVAGARDGFGRTIAARPRSHRGTGAVPSLPSSQELQDSSCLVTQQSLPDLSITQEQGSGTAAGLQEL